jgi:hypothetical protein
MMMESQRPGQNGLSEQLKVFYALSPGVGHTEKLKHVLTADKPENTEAKKPPGEHEHHETSPEELRKIGRTMTLKAVLGITGMLIGLFIGTIPGLGLVGLILSPVLGIIFFSLGGKEPEGGHH